VQTNTPNINGTLHTNWLKRKPETTEAKDKNLLAKMLLPKAQEIPQSVKT
jgi:hypothetical protein